MRTAIIWRNLKITFDEASWQASKKDFQSIAYLETKVALEFSVVSLEDTDLEQLRGWRNIVSIWISSGPRISNTALEHIATLPNLHRLHIVSGRISFIATPTLVLRSAR
jgi:hypothetical protein